MPLMKGPEAYESLCLLIQLVGKGSKLLVIFATMDKHGFLTISVTLNSQNRNNTIASLVLKGNKLLLGYQLILRWKGSI